MASDLCPTCGQPAAGLYASHAQGLVCFACLDGLEPATVDRYDGWRDRELDRQRRADLARKNFFSEPHDDSRLPRGGARTHHAPLFSEGGSPNA